MLHPFLLVLFLGVWVIPSSRVVLGDGLWFCFLVEYVAGCSQHPLRAQPVPEGFPRCGHTQTHMGSLGVVPVNQALHRFLLPSINLSTISASSIVKFIARSLRTEDRTLSWRRLILSSTGSMPPQQTPARTPNTESYRKTQICLHVAGIQAWMNLGLLPLSGT